MRPSGLPNFRKPWGTIQQDLPKGSYTLTVHNPRNLTGWGGDRGIVLTSVAAPGGANYIVPLSIFILALMTIAAAIFFCIRFWGLRGLKPPSS